MLSTLTTHQEINELLQNLALQIQTLLENVFIGLYVGGSLATHSFQYETSDIDCYIITTTVLEEDLVSKIEDMHHQLYSSKLKYAKKIEASYIPQQDLLDFDPNAKRPYFNEKQFYWGQYGNNYLIELHVLREKGKTILGPDIKTLIKPISAQDLKIAIQKNLHEYWEISLDDITKFSSSEAQVFAILTMCRTLYSLETGHITSKANAAQWVVQGLNIEWKGLIEQALIWNPGRAFSQLEKTHRFVKYIISKYGLL